MEEISDLTSRFQTESEKSQLQLVPKLVARGESGLEALMDFLRDHQSEPANLIMGKAYQALLQTDTPKVQEFLKTYFPNGVVPLKSEKNIDYQPLQQLLAQQDFLGADVLTLQKLCEIAGEAAIKRKWLYFTEAGNLPKTDLSTLDQLWLIYSEGKFGFSVQRQIWLSLGQDFAQLWYKIGWKSGNNWTRYPKEFTWDLTAPKGHLPLSNQLRGVRVIASIFAHPVWSTDSN
jgi:hypothetical protein